MGNENQPVLVGVGQHTVRAENLEGAIEPLDMMGLAARRAEEDAETKGLLERADSVRVVNIFAWRYADPAGLLGERVAPRPAKSCTRPWAGTRPSGW